MEHTMPSELNLKTASISSGGAPPLVLEETGSKKICFPKQVSGTESEQPDACPPNPPPCRDQTEDTPAEAAVESVEACPPCPPCPPCSNEEEEKEEPVEDVEEVEDIEEEPSAPPRAPCPPPLLPPCRAVEEPCEEIVCPEDD